MKTDFHEGSATFGTFILLLVILYSCYWYIVYREDLINQEGHEEIHQLAMGFQQSESLMDSIAVESFNLKGENRFSRKEKIFGAVISSGSRDTNKVALTIDDGWDAKWVRQALDCLHEEEVTATFFPTGAAVKANPDLWKHAVREGHELGNHTYTHGYLTSLTEDEIRLDLEQWQKEVDAALGYPYPAFFFRPPGMAGFTGDKEETAYYRELIGKNDLIIALWDIETYYALYSSGGPRHKGTELTPEIVAEYIVEEAFGGSIILLHFTRLDVGAIPLLIRGLGEKGLEVVSLSEMLLGIEEGNPYQAL